MRRLYLLKNKFLLIIIALMMPGVALSEKTLTVAVIDTGIDASSSNLCKFGHKSFHTTSPDPLRDDIGHGTHIAGIINSHAGPGDYCLVSIKFYESTESPNNLINLIRAIQYAVNIKVDIINISGGGPEYIKQEHVVTEAALNKNIKMVVAAGNEGIDLDKNCNYFPICYDKRVIGVGNLISANKRASTSNYGDRVAQWEIGTNVESTLPGGKTGRFSGTSQAAAIATGKLISNSLKK